MKKSILILFATFISVFALNQRSYSQIFLWTKAGVNSSWTSLDFYDNLPHTDGGRVYISTPMNYGYNVSLIIDFPLGKVLSLRPEIEYREFKISRNIERIENLPVNVLYYNSRSRSEVRRYITIPINIVAHLKSVNNEFQLFSGVYFSHGLNGGRYEDTIYSLSNEYGENEIIDEGKLKAQTVPLPFAYHRGYYNPFDFGFNFGVSYKIKRFIISSQFILGMVNTQPYYQDWDGNKTDNLRTEHITKNRSLLLNLAFKIAKISVE